MSSEEDELLLGCEEFELVEEELELVEEEEEILFSSPGCIVSRFELEERLPRLNLSVSREDF